VGLIWLGFGCTAKPIDSTPVNNGVGKVETATGMLDSVVTSSTLVVTSTDKAPTILRTFTLEEIEAKGGLKNWFRDLARANVAGKKILVRVPVNHLFGFGCVSPTAYCVSTETTGCLGPFVNLKGDFAALKKAANQCEAMCNTANDERCTQEFRNDQCSTLWDVEGYVVAANRLPEAKDDGTPGTCADGELTYDFQVTRVIQKIAGGYDDGYQFVEYK
jgi:hypothetical protein